MRTASVKIFSQMLQLSNNQNFNIDYFKQTWKKKKRGGGLKKKTTFFWQCHMIDCHFNQKRSFLGLRPNPFQTQKLEKNILERLQPPFKYFANETQDRLTEIILERLYSPPPPHPNFQKFRIGNTH